MVPGGNSWPIITVAVLAIVLGTLAVGLRIYTRHVVLNQLWIDDYVAMVAWVRLISLDVCNIYFECHADRQSCCRLASLP